MGNHCYGLFLCSPPQESKLHQSHEKASIVTSIPPGLIQTLVFSTLSNWKRNGLEQPKALRNISLNRLGKITYQFTQSQFSPLETFKRLEPSDSLSNVAVINEHKPVA